MPPTAEKAESLLREGRLEEALVQLQNDIRAQPAEAPLRVFLFQLLCVMGRWDRALTQLNVAAEIDPLNLLMSQVCGPALQCEALRAKVFAGERSPLIFGEPEEWVGWMVQANALGATGKPEEARALRDKALEAAPAISGTMDDKPFEWLMDADIRLGPIVEAIIEGRYYWVPMSRIAMLEVEKPADLRDLVWAPSRLTWTNGGQTVALIPSRYPGTESTDDGDLMMARRTQWAEAADGASHGLGHRLWATDTDDAPMLSVRQIVLGDGPPAEVEADADADGKQAPSEGADG